MRPFPQYGLKNKILVLCKVSYRLLIRLLLCLQVMNALSFLIDLIPSAGWQYFHCQFSIKRFLPGPPWPLGAQLWGVIWEPSSKSRWCLSSCSMHRQSKPGWASIFKNVKSATLLSGYLPTVRKTILRRGSQGVETPTAHKILMTQTEETWGSKIPPSAKVLLIFCHPGISK